MTSCLSNSPFSQLHQLINDELTFRGAHGADAFLEDVICMWAFQGLPDM